MLYYATSNNLWLCTTWQNGETRKLYFSPKCCISAVPEFNQSLLDFFKLFDSRLALWLPKSCNQCVQLRAAGGLVQEKGSREHCRSWTVLHAQCTSALSSGFPLSLVNAEVLDRWESTAAVGVWWRWALVSPDGVAPSRMVGVSASVNLPLHHKVQKFSSGTGSPGWSRKKGRKTVVVLDRWGKKTKHRLTSYFFTSAKNYHNRIVCNVYVKIIASQRWDVFSTDLSTFNYEFMVNNSPMACICICATMWKQDVINKTGST